MKSLPRLLNTRPALEQILISTLPALIFGVIVGAVLDFSAAGYYALTLLAVLGGILGGMEHETTAEGAQRGLVGGLVFGAGVLAGHQLLSRRAQVALPHPESAQVIIAALFGVPISAFGAWLRIRRARQLAPPESATEERIYPVDSTYAPEP